MYPDTITKLDVLALRASTPEHRVGRSQLLNELVDVAFSQMDPKQRRNLKREIKSQQ